MTRFTWMAAALACASPLCIAAQAPAKDPAPAPNQRRAQPAVPTAEDRAAMAMMAAETALKPGEFHWRADAPSAGQLMIIVSITDQKLYASRGGAMFAVSTVSTGRPGHTTPRGEFPIIEKQREHYSNLYNSAPMPFMQRLTPDGIALHAGKLPGHPASHGCIRLPLAFARLLFGVTERGGRVVVTDRSLAAPAVEIVPVDGNTSQPFASAAAVATAAAPKAEARNLTRAGVAAGA